MTYGEERVFVMLQAAILARETDAEKRMERMEEFSQIGLSIRDWEDRLKEALKEEENGEPAIETVDRYYAKYNVYDEHGPVFYRKRVGNDYRYVTITFDRNKPEDKQFLVEEYPDLDNMSLSELEDYLDEVESALSDLEDDELEEEDKEEYERLQETYDDLEDLMDELEERISALQEAEKNG